MLFRLVIETLNKSIRSDIIVKCPDKETLESYLEEIYGKGLKLAKIISTIEPDAKKVDILNSLDNITDSDEEDSIISWHHYMKI